MEDYKTKKMVEEKQTEIEKPSSCCDSSSSIEKETKESDNKSCCG